jgi:membrane-bound lytic murein transglycosylase D
LVSDLVGAPVDEMEALNPSLLRMVTPPDAPFDLHLPAGTATLFDQRVALIPEARRNSWRYHPVVAGDTLASVAEEYRVSQTELAAANQLSAGDSIASVDALVVPVPPAAEPSARMRLYTVRRGDTLVTIADRFGVSLSQLRAWNAIPSGIRVAPGRRLHVAEPTPVGTASRRRRGAISTGPGTGAKAGGGARTGSGSRPGTHSGAGTTRRGGAASTHKPTTAAKRRSHVAKTG